MIQGSRQCRTHIVMLARKKLLGEVRVEVVMKVAHSMKSHLASALSQLCTALTPA